MNTQIALTFYASFKVSCDELFDTHITHTHIFVHEYADRPDILRELQGVIYCAVRHIYNTHACMHAYADRPDTLRELQGAMY